MKEYIEREKLTKHIEDEIEAFGNPSESQNPLAYGGVLALSYCKSVAVTLPTADVVEVRHGEWKPIDPESDVRFFCSKCETEISTSWDYDEAEMWRYCPWCGAKMDGERKEQG